MLLYISSLLIYHLFFQIDTNLTSKYILITEKKTWSEAQHYCQKYHTDLASVRNEAEKSSIQNIIQNTMLNTIQASSLPFTYFVLHFEHRVKNIISSCKTFYRKRCGSACIESGGGLTRAAQPSETG